MDQTEAEDIIMRWQEYTEELCKELYKIFTTQITTKVWSDILESKHPGLQSKVGLRKHHYKQN